MALTGARVATVGFRCDATPLTGVGHLIRCIALAEELVDRSVAVMFLGDFSGLPWAQRQLQQRGMTFCASESDPLALAGQCTDLGVDALILDGYQLDSGCGEAVRRMGIIVLAVVDGTFGAGQQADIYLDQNLDATHLPDLPDGATMLAGIEFALLRDSVRILRRPGQRPPASGGGQRASVLAVFGGTDPYDAALELVPILLDTGLPQAIRVVASRPNAAQTLRDLPTLPGQKLEVIEPVDDLAGLAAKCDLVVSAAGSSVWELLCLGVPAAVVCVTPNQEVGYRRVVGRRIVGPLGRLDALQQDPLARVSAGTVLAELLANPSLRAQQAARGLSLVDGRGRERVADALLFHIEDAST